MLCDPHAPPNAPLSVARVDHTTCDKSDIVEGHEKGGKYGIGQIWRGKPKSRIWFLRIVL